MSGYQKPKTGLHKEFVYLNDDTIMNSLSALEAGKVDEILQKVSETREKGFATPAVLKLRPVGSAPDVTAKVIVAVPDAE